MFNPLRRAERLASKEEKELGTTSWAWWPWSLKRSSSGRYATIGLDPDAEEKKYVFTIDTFSILSWHTWTFISCAVSGVLLYLNFTQYKIGPEIGKDQHGTRNILGSLQLAAKAHEITMIVSLGNIAQQWIQRCLLDDGLLLGLLGAENSLSNVSLLISREFRAAVCCSVAMLRHRGEGQYPRHQQKRGKAMILLMGWLALSCLLCCLAGPASAVLMIPRYDWFHETDALREPVTTGRGSSARIGEQYGVDNPYVHYPNVFIAPQLDTRRVATHGIKFQVESRYWRSVMSFRDATRESHYLYGNPGSYAQTRIRVTTTPDRPLVVSPVSEGVTTLSSVMTAGIVKTNLRLRGDGIPPKGLRPEVTYSAELFGIEVKTTCRRQVKETCEHAAQGAGSSLDWCYRHVAEKPLNGPQLGTQNLLLINYNTYYGLRLWITEGPIVTSTDFSDSIAVIFEEISKETFQNPSLVVCSISAEFKLATASSSAYPFSPEKLEFDDTRIYPRGKYTTKEPRKLLYHRSWLESIHGRNESIEESTRNFGTGEWKPCAYSNDSIYSRGTIRLPLNEYLMYWGNDFSYAVGYSTFSKWWEEPQAHIEASLPETIIGGLFISAFLNLNTSRSQYPQGDFQLSPEYSPGLAQEPIEDYSMDEHPPISVKYLLYGFKISTRTSIISVVVLIAHAILVLIGSLWQYRSISLTRAWGSIPEYAMLCLGSDPARATCGVENTCAGIGQDETLNKVVRIREVAEEHLELFVVSPETTMLGSVVNPEKRYGSLRQGGRMKEKLE